MLKHVPIIAYPAYRLLRLAVPFHDSLVVAILLKAQLSDFPAVTCLEELILAVIRVAMLALRR